MDAKTSLAHHDQRTLQAFVGVAGLEGTLQPSLAGLQVHLINRDHTTSSSRLSSFVFSLFASQLPPVIPFPSFPPDPRCRAIWPVWLQRQSTILSLLLGFFLSFCLFTRSLPPPIALATRSLIETPALTSLFSCRLHIFIRETNHAILSHTLGLDH